MLLILSGLLVAVCFCAATEAPCSDATSEKCVDGRPTLPAWWSSNREELDALVNAHPGHHYRPTLVPWEQSGHTQDDPQRDAYLDILVNGLPKVGSRRIAVVGAGMAGLAAAYELLKAGHDVT